MLILVNFYERYIKLCASIQKAPSKVSEEIGLSRAAVNGWKNGKSNPTDATKQRIAEYFGIDVEYFNDENADIKKEPAQSGSSDLDMLFLNAMHQLSPDEQLSIMAKIHSLLEKK